MGFVGKRLQFTKLFIKFKSLVVWMIVVHLVTVVPLKTWRPVLQAEEQPLVPAEQRPRHRLARVPLRWAVQMVLITPYQVTPSGSLEMLRLGVARRL